MTIPRRNSVMASPRALRIGLAVGAVVVVAFAIAIVVDELTAPPCVEFEYRSIPMGKVSPTQTICKRRAPQ